MRRAFRHRPSLPIAAICLVMLTVLTGTTLATTWTVHPDGSGDFPTIGTAVIAAADGDIIQLGDGVFTGPGNWDIYLLNRDLTIRSISNDPVDCQIDCYEGPEAHRGFHIDGGAPNISGLRIRNGRAVTGGAVLVSAGTPSFDNCDFRGCETSATGGGVQVESGAAPEFFDCWFWANDAGTLGGGAFLAAGSDAQFTFCLFGHNSAISDGGGLAALSSGGQFTDCDFRYNLSSSHGGGAYVAVGAGPTFEDTTFKWNSAAYGGGAACSGATSPVFDTCTFFDNRGVQQGGAVFSSATATPEITSCTLIYNESLDGAGFYCETLALPWITNTLVIYNHGTAFGSDGSATANFDCCDLFGNWDGDWTGGIAGQLGIDGNINLDPYIMAPTNETVFLTSGSPCAAENNPGCGQIGANGVIVNGRPGYEVFGDDMGMLPTLQAAIDLAPVGAAVIASGTFTGEGNRDLDFGGKDLGLYGDGPATTIIDCEGTNADRHRGFDFHGGETGAATVENLTIRNGYGGYDPNHAGGGMIIRDGSSPTIRDVRFEDCTTTTSGGGVAIRDTLSEPVIIDCVFEGNDASTGGGGLWAASKSIPWVRDCEFIANTASAGGGGMSLSNSLQTSIRGCTFLNNEVAAGAGGGFRLATWSSVVIDSCVFYGNVATSGAGVSISTNSDHDVLIQDCQFESNDATSGGGIYAWAGGELTLSRVQLIYNTAGQGGGLFLRQGCGVLGVDVLFEGNVATTEGGGVYQDPTGGFLQLDACTFDSNEVSATAGQGAGLWLATSSYFSGCEIRDNVISVAGRGGGFYAAPGASVGMEVCTLQQNSAAFGGAIFALQATLGLDSCWILDNLATYAAAAYLDQDAGSLFEFCTVTDNTAGSTGGAMICDNGSAPELRQCSFVGNSTGTYGAHLVSWHGSQPNIENSIFVFAPQGQAIGVGLEGGIPYFFCSDIYGNAGGDWVGDIAPQINDDANFSADPLFCDLAGDDLTLFNTSPCLPANSGCGHLVGAWPEGCVDPNTGVPEELPAAYALERNVPNPFNPATSLSFALPEPATVTLAIYDASGRRVRTLIGGESYPAGRHEARWNGQDDVGRPVGSGVYLFRLTAGDQEFRRKGVLLK